MEISIIAQISFLALRDAFRSGDLYIPESKQHVSFWDLLISDARSILYWNTVKMGATVDCLRAAGETINDEDLSHVSLLPFKHVMPNGTYFIEG